MSVAVWVQYPRESRTAWRRASSAMDDEQAAEAFIAGWRPIYPPGMLFETRPCPPDTPRLGLVR